MKARGKAAKNDTSLDDPRSGRLGSDSAKKVSETLSLGLAGIGKRFSGQPPENLPQDICRQHSALLRKARLPVGKDISYQHEVRPSYMMRCQAQIGLKAILESLFDGSTRSHLEEVGGSVSFNREIRSRPTKRLEIAATAPRTWHLCSEK
jgi:hypothetical protein